jgi:hypothetical protein
VGYLPLAPVPLTCTSARGRAGSLLEIAMHPESVPHPLGRYETESCREVPGDTEKLLDDTRNSSLVPLHRATPLT